MQIEVGPVGDEYRGCLWIAIAIAILVIAFSVSDVMDVWTKTSCRDCKKALPVVCPDCAKKALDMEKAKAEVKKEMEVDAEKPTEPEPEKSSR